MAGRCQIQDLPLVAEGAKISDMMRLFVNRGKRFSRRRYRFAMNFIKDIDSDKTHHCLASSSTEVLSPGDVVRVRSRMEIQESLSFWNDLNGCSFMEEMTAYCDTVQRVYKKVETFLDERDYLVKRCKGIYLLENVICNGTQDFGRCDRSCFYFWKREWLEKLH